MKDNKIDIMCNKIGHIITILNGREIAKELNVGIIEALRQLQYDLEILRKCTLDNPDFKWEDVIIPADKLTDSKW